MPDRFPEGSGVNQPPDGNGRRREANQPDGAIPLSASGASPKRLLLIKFGSIGDVIMAIPGAALMHAKGYAVDWVAGEVVASVLGLYPWINVIVVDERGLLQGSLRVRLRAVLNLWQSLWKQTRRHGRYALSATLYYDARYRLLSLFVPAARRVRLSGADRRTALLAGRHHTDEYARILTGRPDAETPFQLAPVPAPVLPSLAVPLCGDRPRVVLVPGGARNVLRDDALRRWPVESYVHLARLLLGQGCQVVLAGGREDGWVVPHFAQLAAEFAAEAPPGAFVDRIGACSLVDTLALFGTARVTVTHDTGPLHLAGLTSTAIVALFGPTDPHGRLPRRANVTALWGGEGFGCRPCYDGREYAACQHNGCIRQITPALVLAQIRRLLDAGARGQELPPCVVAPDPAGFVPLGALEPQISL